MNKGVEIYLFIQYYLLSAYCVPGAVGIQQWTEQTKIPDLMDTEELENK